MGYEPCNISSVVLADFPQWADEHGYWVGEYSYFGASMTPTYVPETWNYPYDHYRGFITGSVRDGSYSQRNTFLYPPQTAYHCALNNNTYLDEEPCGSTGSAKLFQADQTTKYCDRNDGGRISGAYGEDSTTTTLIGDQAVLYQIWSANKAGEMVFYQSQMTTITHSDGNVRRTRTAQFFDKETGEAAWFSFYREQKVPESVFWSQFNTTLAEYNVSDATIARRCHGGLASLKRFMEGSMDWDGDKYACPVPPPSATSGSESPLALWTAAGVSGWASYYPSDPVTRGTFLTSAEIARIPGGTVASLADYGWVTTVTSPPYIWTAVGVAGWAGYYPSNPLTEGSFVTLGQLAQVPGATVTSLEGYGWTAALASPSAIWTAAGVVGWAGYYPSDPVAEGTFLIAAQLAKVPGATVTSLAGYGWVDSLASPSAVWTGSGVAGWAVYYPSDPVTEGAFLTAGQLAQIPGATVASLSGYDWVQILA